MSDIPSGANNVQAIIETARRGASPYFLGELPQNNHLMFVPNLGDGTVVDLEKHLAVPVRKRGQVAVFDAASFNIVIADNMDAGDVSIYIDRNPVKPAVVAVLNGHGKKGAGWADFRAVLQFRETPQWQRWNAINDKFLPQLAFAEFIEDNLEDIADPSGATMLEIATYLEATKAVDFKSGIRLSNGLGQLQNSESIDAKVGTGKIAIPEVFTLAIAPFFGIDRYKVPARFRYRITDGKLTLAFKLQRSEDLMEQVLGDILAKIERGTNISVLEGLPPPATR